MAHSPPAPPAFYGLLEYSHAVDRELIENI